MLTKTCCAAFLILIVSIYTSTNCFCQTDINRQINLPTLVSASPEATALAKFGQIPVNNYRGIPNISIPLFKINEGLIELPISLDYHAGGIKVEEMASNIGLGWALNSGGVITRSLKGLQDEIGYFSDYTSVYNYTHGLLNTSQVDSFLLNVYHKLVDAEPDIFYFNFGANSGKFFCSEAGKLFTSPRSDLKIEFDSSGITITDGKGIKYSFKNTETSITEPYCSSGGGGYSNNDQTDYISAWYLTCIEDPLHNKINFTYTNGGASFRTKSITSYYLANGGTSCTSYFTDCYNDNSVTRPRLSEINFSSGKIKFEYASGARSDGGESQIDKISMINYKGDTVKKYNFFTSYFTTNSVGGCDDGISYRLRLDSLQQSGIGSVSLPSYKFNYNATQLPCRLSNAQDHWGYYNGVNNSTFLMYKTTSDGPWVGANKEPDSNYVRAGILEKITYPTGGRTEFTYEPNMYSTFEEEGYDTNNSLFLKSLSGNNSSNGGNYIVNFSDTFSISSGSIPSPGYRLVTAALSTYVDNTSLVHTIILQLTGSNGYSKEVHDGDTLHLTTGSYTISGSIETEFAGNPYAEFHLDLNGNVYKPDRFTTHLYGGVRVRKIKNYADSTTVADEKNFVYTSFNIPTLADSASSGDFSAILDNSYYSYEKTTCPPSPGTCCPYIVYNSISNYPLLHTNGSPIGYRNVTVMEGPNGANGKHQYTYTSYTDYPDAVSFTFPFFFASEYDWTKGLLLKTTDYKYSSGSFSPVQEKITTYDLHDGDTTKKMSRGVVLGKSVEYSSADAQSILNGLSTATYDLPAPAFNSQSDTLKTYDQNTTSVFLKQTSAYTYNPKNFQLAKVKIFPSSKGDTLTKNYRYALDYSASNSNSNRGKSIWTLQNGNIISQPIESYSTIIKSGSEYVVNGNLNLYRTALPLLDTIYSIESASLISLGSFSASSVDGSNNFSFYSGYKPQVVESRFTSQGKIAELNKNKDFRISYIWDYNGVSPIAEVKNADSASIAYTSFEAESNGNWSGINASYIDSSSSGATGKKFYNQSSFSLSKSGLNSSGYYVVSYWSKNGSYTVSGTQGSAKTLNSIILGGVTWTLYEHLLTGQSTITVSSSGTSSIDELRLYPREALVTTYTYTPLLGITSISDPSGKIVYYNYDKLGRLQTIKDQNQNILKMYDYKYVSQQ